MPSPIAYASLFAVLALPLVAVAAPVEEPAVVDEDAAVPAEPEPAIAPPSAVQPVVATPPPQVDANPCGGHWRSHRMRGRLALGFSKGHLELDDDTEAHQKSLLARVVLHHGFEVEVELSKMELAGDDTHTGGVSLLRSFGHHWLRPYVIAGMGGGRIERADGTDDRLHYAEFGGGLMLRKRRLAIGLDVRRGVRKLDGDDEMTVDVERAVTTPSSEDHERYVRGRILALVYF